MTCRTCYLARSRNKGKGKACPYSQARLCETGNRYRTKVIFLLLELEGREEGLIPSILKHSPWSQFLSVLIPNTEQPTEHSPLEVSNKEKVQTSSYTPHCSAWLGRKHRADIFLQKENQKLS